MNQNPYNDRGGFLMNVFLHGKNIQDECISNIVSLGDFVFVSGQTGQGQTIEQQARTACEKLDGQLSLMHLEIRHIVKTTIYLKHLEDREVFLQVYKQFFEAPYPACTIIGVDHLQEDALVQIEAFALNTLRYEKSMKDSHCSDCGGC